MAGALPRQQPPSQTSPSAVLHISVTDGYGRDITGLQPADFLISVDNIPATISSFSAGDAPAGIGILLDVSGVMKDKEPRFDVLLKGLIQFAEQSNPADRFFINVMAAKPLLVTDWTQPGAALAAGIEEAGKASVRGKAFYDACDLAITKMNETQLSKRILLVVSNGQDNGSKVNMAQLRRRLEESGTIMFSIAKIDPASDSLGGVGRSILEELSKVSGGEVYFPGTSPEALSSFNRVAGEIRHQYAIGINAGNLKGDGKLHPVKARVNPQQPPAGAQSSKLRVLTRQYLFDASRARPVSLSKRDGPSDQSTTRRITSFLDGRAH
jgi:VWFA-related protein